MVYCYIKDRCNLIDDCTDRSDEQNCELIVFPENYNEIEPPETMNTSEALSITNFIKIESIDGVPGVDSILSCDIRQCFTRGNSR